MKFKSPFKILNLEDDFGPLTVGEFCERLNRFVATVKVKGSIRKVHISDTGRLRELLRKGAPVLLAPNPRGKLDYKLVCVRAEDGWVLVNTSVHSKLAKVLIKEGFLGFEPKEVLSEVRVGSSRIDFLVDGNFFIEVKGCNLLKGRVCLFPDAPTKRGLRHLRELLNLRSMGFRTGLLFLVFRDCDCFLPNFETDRKFSSVFSEAIDLGVELFLIRLSIVKKWWISFAGKLSLCS